MKMQQILQQKYTPDTDMYRKIESTKVCMLYNDLVTHTFRELSFSKSQSIRGNTLTVIAGSHIQASQIKLFEFDILEQINQLIESADYRVERIRVSIESV